MFQGSITVFINGKPAARIGDQTKHCGGMGTLVEGSSNVIVGGPPGKGSSSGGGGGGGSVGAGGGGGGGAGASYTSGGGGGGGGGGASSGSGGGGGASGGASTHAQGSGGGAGAGSGGGAGAGSGGGAGTGSGGGAGTGSGGATGTGTGGKDDAGTAGSGGGTSEGPPDPDQKFVVRASVEKDDKPIAGASYEIVSAGKVVGSGTTKEDGHIEQELPSGSYEVRITKVQDKDMPKDHKPGAPLGSAQVIAKVKDGASSFTPIVIGMQDECGHELQSDIDKLINREFFDKGTWSGGRFANACLHRLLNHLCGEDGIDPSAMQNVAVQGRGGDAESETNGLPTWLQTWRNNVSNTPGWNRTLHEPRAKLGEAFLWTFLRQKCGENGVAMPPSADYLLEHLFKSNSNGALGQAGGGTGSIACAGVSNKAFMVALERRGYKARSRYWMGSGGNDAGKPPYFYQTGVKAHKEEALSIRPLPGDILDWTANKGPWSGHVVTIVCPETNSYADGKIWVISGNTAPGGTIAVDYVSLMRPYDGYANWSSEGTRPPPGYVYPAAICRCSMIMPDELDKMDEPTRTSLRVTTL